MSMSEKRNIVIVGGGGAGAPIARMLSEELDVTKYNLILVTSRPYYTHLPAWIRMSVTEEGHLEDRAHITYNFNFYNGNGEFVIGKVASIVTEEGDKPGHILLESGQRVDYEVLILTPGSVREGPLDIPDTKEETVQWLKMWRGKFRDAEDIVLVGGGAVALEYAGELKDYYPKKRVTIVHKHEWLLNDAYPKYFRKQVQKGVEKRGVQVILNDQIEDLEIKAGGTIVTKNGRRLVADLVVPCRGPKPNSGFVTIDPGSLSPSKHVKVSTTMQVRNYPRIFAAGDVIDRDEQKQVSKYHAHASVVAKNVVDLLAGKQPSALYQGCFEMISITNGKGGSSYWSVFWGPTFGDWVSSTLKSKDLFLTWTRKSMGLKG